MWAWPRRISRRLIVEEEEARGQVRSIPWRYVEGHPSLDSRRSLEAERRSCLGLSAPLSGNPSDIRDCTPERVALWPLMGWTVVTWSGGGDEQDVT